MFSDMTVEAPFATVASPRLPALFRLLHGGVQSQISALARQNGVSASVFLFLARWLWIVGPALTVLTVASLSIFSRQPAIRAVMRYLWQRRFFFARAVCVAGSFLAVEYIAHEVRPAAKAILAGWTALIPGMLSIVNISHKTIQGTVAGTMEAVSIAAAVLLAQTNNDQAELLYQFPGLRPVLYTAIAAMALAGTDLFGVAMDKPVLRKAARVPVVLARMFIRLVVRPCVASIRLAVTVSASFMVHSIRALLSYLLRLSRVVSRAAYRLAVAAVRVGTIALCRVIALAHWAWREVIVRFAYLYLWGGVSLAAVGAWMIYYGACDLKSMWGTGPSGSLQTLFAAWVTLGGRARSDLTGPTQGLFLFICAVWLQGCVAWTARRQYHAKHAARTGMTAYRYVDRSLLHLVSLVTFLVITMGMTAPTATPKSIDPPLPGDVLLLRDAIMATGRFSMEGSDALACLALGSICSLLGCELLLIFVSNITSAPLPSVTLAILEAVAWGLNLAYHTMTPLLQLVMVYRFHGSIAPGVIFLLQAAGSVHQRTRPRVGYTAPDNLFATALELVYVATERLFTLVMRAAETLERVISNLVVDIGFTLMVLALMGARWTGEKLLLTGRYAAAIATFVVRMTTRLLGWVGASTAAAVTFLANRLVAAACLMWTKVTAATVFLLQVLARAARAAARCGLSAALYIMIQVRHFALLVNIHVILPVARALGSMCAILAGWASQVLGWASAVSVRAWEMIVVAFAIARRGVSSTAAAVMRIAKSVINRCVLQWKSLVAWWRSPPGPMMLRLYRLCSYLRSACVKFLSRVVDAFFRASEVAILAVYAVATFLSDCCTSVCDWTTTHYRIFKAAFWALVLHTGLRMAAPTLDDGFIHPAGLRIFLLTCMSLLSVELALRAVQDLSSDPTFENTRLVRFLRLNSIRDLFHSEVVVPFCGALCDLLVGCYTMVLSMLGIVSSAIASLVMTMVNVGCAIGREFLRIVWIAGGWTRLAVELLCRAVHRMWTIIPGIMFAAAGLSFLFHSSGVFLRMSYSEMTWPECLSEAGFLLAAWASFVNALMVASNLGLDPSPPSLESLAFKLHGNLDVGLLAVLSFTVRALLGGARQLSAAVYIMVRTVRFRVLSPIRNAVWKAIIAVWRNAVLSWLASALVIVTLYWMDSNRDVLLAHSDDLLPVLKSAISFEATREHFGKYAPGSIMASVYDAYASVSTSGAGRIHLSTSSFGTGSNLFTSPSARAMNEPVAFAFATLASIGSSSIAAWSIYLLNAVVMVAVRLSGAARLRAKTVTVPLTAIYAFLFWTGTFLEDSFIERSAAIRALSVIVAVTLASCYAVVSVWVVEINDRNFARAVAATAAQDQSVRVAQESSTANSQRVSLTKRNEPISAALKRVTRYNNGECAVCTDDFAENDGAIQVLQCGHAFHKACVEQWFEYSSQCPTCRAPHSRRARLVHTVF